MSKFTVLKQNLGVVVLGLILLVGVGLRWPSVSLIKCDYLDDCGRDLLVAKRVAEGKTSLWASPSTALESAKSSPQYYVILAGLYRLGGLEAISYFNLAVGLSVIMLNYLIVIQVTRDRVLGWFAALITSFLPIFITASIVTWQPHWEYLFGGLSLWLCLKAWEEKTFFWHVFAALSLIPLIHQEYFALPFAAIFTVFLIFSWVQKRKSKATSHKWVQTVGLFIAIAVVWGTLVRVLVVLEGQSVMKNLVYETKNSEIFTFDTVLKKLTLMPHAVLYSLTDPVKYERFWKLQLGLIFVILAYAWHTAKTKSTKVQFGLLGVLLLSILAVVIEPGTAVEYWHFTLQRQLFVLLLVMVPYFLRLRHHWLYLYEVSLVALLILHNTFLLKGLLEHETYAFTDSTELVQLIHTDVQSQQLGFTQFRLIVMRRQLPSWMIHGDVSEATNVAFWATTYDTAGVQLGLELLDPRYEARAAVVPATEFWSNYLQVPSEVYYVICQQYSPSTKDQCIKNLALPESVHESEAFIGKVNLSRKDIGYLYRLSFTKPATSSQSAEFSLQ